MGVYDLVSDILPGVPALPSIFGLQIHEEGDRLSAGTSSTSVCSAVTSAAFGLVWGWDTTEKGKR